MQDGGIRVVQTPYQAPNANAYAERFVRSIKEEGLDRLIPFGERHLRRAVTKFVARWAPQLLRASGVNALVASGGADLDYSAIGTVLFRLAGHDSRATAKS